MNANKRSAGSALSWAEPETAPLAAEDSGALAAGPRNPRKHPDASLTTLFESQAAATPGRAALRFGTARLTYSELNSRANRLARLLLAHGVQTEMRVAMGLNRGLDAVIAMLAILKTGAAYVPLSPSDPPARFLAAVELAAPTVIVTNAESSANLPVTLTPVIDLSTAEPELASCSPENLGVPIEPDNLAYIMYTSGSTGEPKGVAIPHSGVVRLTKNATWAQLSADEVFLQMAPLGFDASTLEIWAPLLNGGELVIFSRPAITVDSIAATLADEGITTLWLTAGLFRELAAHRPDCFSGLRQLIAGGDVLPVELVREVASRHPLCTLINGYGPTECTTFATAYTVREPDELRGSVPIGSPIDGTAIYILDDDLRPVPIGAPGRIYIAGYGLARGYQGQARLSAAAFIPDPFSPTSGARMYDSGDRGRRISGDDIEFLGRSDSQVKVRGFRVDPAEVEALLASLAAVRRCAVAPLTDESGHKHLAAWVELRPGSNDDPASLRRALSGLAPDYLIPSTIEIVTAIPLSPNGKIDRNALASFVPATQPTQNGARPLTQTEKILAEIWREVLQLDDVAVDASFFDLGGDSMRAIQMIAGAEARGLNIEAALIFQYQTIRELAAELPALEEPISRSAQTEPFSLVPDSFRQQLSADVEDSYPLTKLQAGMVFHSELNPESPVYHDFTSYRLRSPWNQEALQTAVRKVARRHPVLRTSFDMSSFGEPMQLVHHDVAPPIEIQDLRGISAGQQQQRLSHWIESEKHAPFVWSSAPLWRVHVHRLEDAVFQFSVSFHHSILDGWSVAVLLGDLMRNYLSLSGVGEPADDLPLASTFRDTVALERDALNRDETRRFWMDLLRDAPRSILPRWPGALAADEQASVPVGISRFVSEQLKRVAQMSNVPLKSVLLAAHVKALGYLCGAREVVTGLVSHNRPNAPDGERILGLFLNALPLRFRLEPGSWIDLARGVFDCETSALPHKSYPMAELQREIGGAPIFETSLTYTHFHVFRELSALEGVDVLGSTDFAIAHLPFAALFGQNPISLDIELGLSFDASQFPPPQRDTVASVYASVLERMARQPAERHDLALLLPVAAARVLAAGPDSLQPRIDLAHEVVELQARLRPSEPALIHDGGFLTYSGLDAAANRLARHLQGLGVAPEVRVAICLEWSFDAVVAALAVLKAGGAYVPVDPASPPERLSYILEDSAAVAILTREVFAENLTSPWLQVISMDAEQDLWRHEDSSPPPSSVEPANLAYVLYTSGSTGKPKGVQVTHAGITAVSRAMRTTTPFTSSTRAFQYVSLMWDTATLQLMLVLGAGGSLVLHSAPSRLTNAELLAECERSAVNTLVIPPTALHPLCEDVAKGTVAMPAGIRLLMSGGEIPNPSRIRAFATAAGPLCYINAYGPTEASVNVTAFVSPPGAAWLENLSSIPAGAVLPGVSVHILDRDLHSVPLGTYGEICIGGEGVARGYLNRPDLTAEVFLPDPFSSKYGARLYRSGDRGRLLPSGDLDFLARVDDQVKIRGTRIEPGEIEAALREAVPVSECFVEARADANSDIQLLAFVVPKGNAPFDVAAARAGLQRRLPEVMIPSAFIAIDKLPRTAGGKIDREALRAYRVVSRPADEVHVAPRNPMEEIVAGLWARVLHREAIGVTDDFFEIGGHSLAATHLISTLREVLQLDLPLSMIFELPTVGAFAAAATRLQDSGAAPLDPLQPAPRDKPLAVSFGQERLWILAEMSPLSPAYNMIAAIDLNEPIDPDVLKHSFVELRRRHAVLRSIYPARDGRPAYLVQSADAKGFEFVDLTALAEPARLGACENLMRETVQRPFDLSAGPLTRAALFQLAPDRFRILLVVHHIAADGWSMHIIRNEFPDIYRAFSAGQPSPLPELPLQYSDFSAWQRTQVEQGRFAHQLAYWRRQLGGSPRLVTLPPDRPRSDVLHQAGADFSWNFPHELADVLRARAVSESVTPFMVLAAALAVALGRYAHIEDVAIGVPVSGREALAAQRLVGFFVNTIVLRCDLSGAFSIRELLRRVRKIALDGWANQDLPFERVVQELRPERSPGQSPLFQVMLSYQHTDAAGDSETANRVPDTGAALFDLCVSVADNGRDLACTVQYSAQMYEASTIERFSLYWRSLLTAMIESDPLARVHELALIDVQERRQILARGAARADASPATRCLHEWFEDSVRRWPQRIAVSCAGHSLTYAELDVAANRLAARLRSAGVRPEAVVGVSLERSPELIVALLAVLKAGGAYLPLESSLPVERRRWMIQDAGALCVVSDGSAPAKDYTGLLVVNINPDRAQEIPPPGPGVVQPSNLAYVLYTSGSTGRPKGVMVEHRQVSRLFAITQAGMAFSEEDVWTLFHSFGFDFSVWEIFGALLYGARLVIVPAAAARSPRDFSELLEREQVTILNQTPSAFWQLVAQTPRLPSFIRLVVFGGESLNANRLGQWMRAQERPPRMVNMFGITETTVHVTAIDIHADDPAHGASPIGAQLADLELYLLDGGLNPVSTGVPGEICVGGAGLARGYRNKPALTAERFVPNPFGGGRLYRSGDLGRYLADGSLEHLGRIDHQVKIRGFRIELGEIETVIASYPTVRDCVVLPHEYGEGDTRLVAYVSGLARESENAELRSHLQERLPEYMVPAALIDVPGLPLTANGKLDRAALPDPARYTPSRPMRAPASFTEIALSELWSEMLGCGAVGLDDDFFVLGGHSFLAATMIDRASKLFASRIPLVRFFEHSTLAALAELVEQERPTAEAGLGSHSALLPIRPSGSLTPLFLANPLGYGTATYLRLAKHLGVQQPVYGLQNPFADADALEALAAGYVHEIRQIDPVGPYVLGGWSSGGVVAFEMSRQLVASGAQVRHLFLFDAYTPLLTRVELDDGTLSGLVAMETAHRSGRVLSLRLDEIRAQPPEARLSYVIRALHDAGFTAQTVNEAWMQKLTNGYRRRIALLQKYEPGPYTGAVTLFRCSESEDDVIEAVLNTESGIDVDDGTHGWAAFCEKPIEIVEIPGWHVSMFSEPNVSVVAQKLAAILERRRLAPHGIAVYTAAAPR